MSIRLPVDASQNVQAAFRDVEQELVDLKTAVAALSAGTDLTSINERIDRIQPSPPLNSDAHTFVGSGPQHSAGLVPSPGSYAGTTEMLREDGRWAEPEPAKLPYSDQTPTPGGTDVYNLHGALAVLGPMGAFSLDAGGLSLSNQPCCRLTRTAVQAIPDNTITAISFTSEIFDIGDMHSNTTNPSRITIPEGGVYLIGGHFTFEYINAGTFRYAYLYLNSTTYFQLQFQHVNASSQGQTMQLATMRTFKTGDYIELMAHHDRGGGNTINVTADTGHQYTPIFWAYKLG